MSEGVPSNGRGSAEEVAYRLFMEIAHVEGMSTRERPSGGYTDRRWILDTYAECLMAVTLPSKRLCKDLHAPGAPLRNNFRVSKAAASPVTA
jgi:hypothetical protein